VALFMHENNDCVPPERKHCI